MARMTYDEIETALGRTALQNFGGFHPQPGDRVPAGNRTLIMLGPREPGFWDHFTSQQEIADGAPNPLDRWSRREIDLLADRLKATALYPFDGPPYHPFFSWALRTGRCWQSPVQLLVHDIAGLFVSYRGALAFKQEIPLPAHRPVSPCLECSGRPCLDACPVGALDRRGYDSAACRTHVGSPEGIACLDKGCEVRRSCPVSAAYGRLPEQSRFHQIAFLNR